MWKGDLGGAATILTGSGGGGCGYPFQASWSYLIYASIDPETGIVGTGICSPTKPLDQADEDIAVLDALAEPYEPPAASADELDEWPADETPSSMFGSSGEDGGPADEPAEEEAEEGAVPLTSSTGALVPALLGVAGLAAIALIVLGRRRREGA